VRGIDPKENMYYDDPFTGMGAAFGAMFAALAVILIVPLIIAYVLFSVFYMKLFEKAGVNDKWRAWIPVYREMIFFKIGDGVLSIIYVGSLLLAAFAVFWAMAVIRVSFKAKGEAAWAALALGLPGLGGIIWLGIMAFTKDPWQPQIPQAKWANGFLGDKTDWAGIPFGGVPAPAYGGAQPYGYGAAPADPYGYSAPAPGAPQDPYGAPQGYAAPQAPYGQFDGAQPPAAQDPFAAPAAPQEPYVSPEPPAAPQDPSIAPEAPAEPVAPAAPEEPSTPAAEPSIDFGEPASEPDEDTEPPADPSRS
jgi:hypothetical protein